MLAERIGPRQAILEAGDALIAAPSQDADTIYRGLELLRSTLGEQSGMAVRVSRADARALAGQMRLWASDDRKLLRRRVASALSLLLIH